MTISRRDLDALLRVCIECGLCLPHCATYLATGDERQSPRGRLRLLGRVLAGELDLGDPGVRRSFDLCLGCDACAGVCPSGLDPAPLARARDLAAADRPGPPVQLLARRPLLRRARAVGRRARAVAAALWGPLWRSRLESLPTPLRSAGRLAGSLPDAPDRDRDLVALLTRLLPASAPAADATAAVPAAAPTAAGPGGRAAAAAGATRRAVVLLRGCADEALLPGTARRLRLLLEAGGCRVVAPPGQTCCGAMARHAGRPAEAEALRRRNLAALGPAASGAEAVVAAAAGCSRELRDYPGPIGDLALDAVVLLAGLDLPPPRPLPLRVALHDPCHALHGQGIDEEPRRLLGAIPGLELRRPAEREVCCGAAGPYALRHPDFSARMGLRKARALAATSADLVVTASVGCLGQLAGGLAVEAPGLPVLPLTDLLWFAHLGPRRDAAG